MKCPNCGGRLRTDAGALSSNNVYCRGKKCASCGSRFRTIEYIIDPGRGEDPDWTDAFRKNKKEKVE